MLSGLSQKSSDSLVQLFEKLKDYEQRLPNSVIEYQNQINLVAGVRDLHLLENELTSFVELSPLLDTSLEVHVDGSLCSLVLQSNSNLLIDSPIADLDVENLRHNIPEGQLEDTQFLNSMNQGGAEIRLNLLARELLTLRNTGLEVRVTIRAMLDKTRIPERIGLPTSSKYSFYLSNQQFASYMLSSNFGAITQVYSLGDADRHVVFLASGQGSGKGPYLWLLGIDCWETAWETPELADEDKLKLKNLLSFQQQECDVPISAFSISPVLFRIDTFDFSDQSLLSGINKLKQYYSIIFLASAVKETPTKTTVEFYGGKTEKIDVGIFPGGTEIGDVFSVFAWAFENKQSDKLEIARQVIALYLSPDSTENLRIIGQRTQDILDTVSVNFRAYISNQVVIFSQARLKLLEGLSNYVDQIDESLEELGDGLVSNAFRTMGLAAGLVAAYVLRPDLGIVVLEAAGILTIAYLLIVLGISQSQYWLRFKNKQIQYEEATDFAKGLLSADELQNVKGKTFTSINSIFHGYFFVTTFLYEFVIGVIALMFIKL